MNDEHKEVDAINRQRATATVLGTLGGLAAVLVMIGVMLYATRDQTPDPAIDRAAKLAEARAADTKAQSEFGWIDKNKGVVRLPIDVAIDKTLAEGFKLPASAPSSGPTTQGK